MVLLKTLHDRREYFLSLGGELIEITPEGYLWEFSQIPETEATCKWLQYNSGKDFPISQTRDGEVANGRIAMKFGRWVVEKGKLAYEFPVGTRYEWWEIPILKLKWEIENSLPLTEEEEKILLLERKIADLEKKVRKRNRTIKSLRRAL